jgi:Fe2+ or Zn2+ uptake regulation protein
MKDFSRKNPFSTTLKKAGYKVTQPRILVLSVLEKSRNPLNVKQILEELNQTAIDPSTVYRTLQALERSEMVRKIYFQNDQAYFELKDQKGDHHHIVCISCKKVKDFIGCQYEMLAKEALKTAPEFARVTNHSFELFGLCKACA